MNNYLIFNDNIRYRTLRKRQKKTWNVISLSEHQGFQSSSSDQVIPRRINAGVQGLFSMMTPPKGLVGTIGSQEQVAFRYRIFIMFFLRFHLSFILLFMTYMAICFTSAG